jgi:hypothetical protein
MWIVVRCSTVGEDGGLRLIKLIPVNMYVNDSLLSLAYINIR